MHACILIGEKISPKHAGSRGENNSNSNVQTHTVVVAHDEVGKCSLGNSQRYRCQEGLQGDGVRGGRFLLSHTDSPLSLRHLHLPALKPRQPLHHLHHETHCAFRIRARPCIAHERIMPSLNPRLRIATAV